MCDVLSYRLGLETAHDRIRNLRSMTVKGWPPDLPFCFFYRVSFFLMFYHSLQNNRGHQFAPPLLQNLGQITDLV